MNRIAILDGYDGPDSFGDMGGYRRGGNKVRVSKKRHRAGKKFSRATKACYRRHKSRGKAFWKCVGRKMKRRSRRSSSKRR